jgi:hypothetical protein
MLIMYPVAPATTPHVVGLIRQEQEPFFFSSSSLHRRLCHQTARNIIVVHLSQALASKKTQIMCYMLLQTRSHPERFGRPTQISLLAPEASALDRSAGNMLVV